MRHEELPRREHREVLKAFFRVISPEIRPITANQIGAALVEGDLTETGLDYAVQTLWTTDEMRAVRVAWAKEEGL